VTGPYYYFTSTIGLIFAMDALIFVSLSLAEAKVTIELLAIIQFR